MVPYIFGFLLSRVDRPIFVFIFSLDISPTICSCSVSSSGLVRIGAYRPSRSEVSYVFGVGVPIFSGISSSCHNRLLPCRLPSVCGFGRSLVFRLIYHGVSHPICRICHRGLRGSACFSGLSRRWDSVSSLFASFLLGLK